ncbi:MAG: autotransporter outer membrane beta-barrel domain-containing protein [[Pasteurella] aerogenes]|nr:autotransporter outer membrane beta-barrel domain-containing protein [[Pasteurella] aerogenes]
MNKIYKVKWNAHTQSYMVCSELVKSRGKATKSVLSAVVLGAAFLGNVGDANAAGTCGPYTNDVIETVAFTACVASDVNGDNISATGGLIRVGQQNPLRVNQNWYFTNQNIVAGSETSRKAYTTIGTTISSASWDTAQTRRSTLSGGDVALYMDGSTAGTNSYSGVGAAFGGKIALNNFTLDVANANNGDLNGIQAGGNFGDKNPNGAALQNYIHIYNDYNFKAVKSSLANKNPTTGIRAIQNNNGQGRFGIFPIAGEYGAQAVVTIDGTYTADITAGYGNGVYVSGKWDDTSTMPTVNLNNADITINGSGNALKIGKKARSASSIRDGWGAGTLNFKEGATVNIDQSNATGEAIAITYEGSVLEASDTTAFNVVSQGNTIRVGNDILTNAVQSSSKLIIANINNANFTQTADNTNAMILVDPNQSEVSLNFTGDKTTMTAADKGYFIDVKANSNLTFDATDAGQMTGLTNKTDSSTLNLNLDNNFSWNLREHTAADGSTVKTSTFNTTTLTNGAVINAIKGNGTAAFELTGEVVSKDSVIRLSDNTTTALVTDGQAKAGDVLTITGNYTATNGKVLLDTELGKDSSETDLLHITGNSTGTNTLEVTPVAGSLGAFTQEGIKVVQVDGASDENTNYVLKGDGLVSDDSITIGAENKHKFTYRLYQGTLARPGTETDNGIPDGVDPTSIDANDWYLRSVCSNGSHSVGSGFTTSDNDGLGCITDDKITVTTGADIAKVEGAGGADIILVNSDAKVSGDVYGGNAGVDNSAAQDGNDTITVTGNAVVSGTVYGQTGDDSIIWSGDSSIAGLDGGIGSDTVTVSSSKYDGTQLLDGGDDVNVADGFIDTLSLDGVKVTANGNKITNWESIQLNNATDLALVGTLTTGTGMSPAGDKLGLDISSDSTLAVAGTETTATVQGDVNNAGVIDLTRDDNSPSQTLTIDGNYTGVAGSTIKMDTVLGGDDSATDLVKITGDSTGTTTLDVSAVEGSIGGITKQGIKVVQVDGTSASDNYTLKDGAITVGPENKHQFTYRLYQGTNGATDTTGVDANDWYLRSTCSGTHSVGSAFGVSVYDGLGCITDDTITVTTGADIAKVEGAGGSDTIVINSDAKVNGDVYGGNPGLDDSADADKGDTITIADNAVVTGTVYSQAGDDTITWSDASSIGGLNGGTGSDIATVTSSKYNGSQILDGGDDADVADGWIDTLNLNGVKVTANGGNIRNWEGINLKNTDLTLVGELLTGKGKTADGTQVGLNIDNTSVLAVSGTSAKVSGDVTNAGTIDLTRDGSIPSQTLTIDGDYFGVSGSKVKMNTVWNSTGDANGANSKSDVLAITGSASGQTSVIPMGSDGRELVISGNVAQISSVINTIPVITVGKTGSERVFIGSAVTPSGIEAQLAKRTLNGADQYFWTIGGVEIPVDPVVPPVDPVVPPVVPTTPTYDPRVPGYVLMPRVNMEQGYATLRTLHERRGENQTLAWDNCGTCGEQADGQTWGRILGSNLDVDGKSRLDFETKNFGFQFGHDFAITRTDEGGHRLSGIYVAYNKANTTFKDEYSRENGVLLSDKTSGKGKSEAWTLGATHTRYSPFGAYLDLVGQLSFYRNKYEPRKYDNVSQNGVGFALSAEVGKPYALNSHQPGEAGWLIEPQAQLIYQMVDLNNFNDGTRHVDQGQQHGLRGRIGVRLAYNAQSDKDVFRTNTFYAIANIWSDFVEPSKIKLADNKLNEKYASTWGEVGVGFQLPVLQQAYIYGDARYERELGGAKREGYRGTIGVKYTWK